MRDYQPFQDTIIKTQAECDRLRMKLDRSVELTPALKSYLGSNKEWIEGPNGAILIAWYGDKTIEAIEYLEKYLALCKEFLVLPSPSTSNAEQT